MGIAICFRSRKLRGVCREVQQLLIWKHRRKKKSVVFITHFKPSRSTHAVTLCATEVSAACLLSQTPAKLGSPSPFCFCLRVRVLLVSPSPLGFNPQPLLHPLAHVAACAVPREELGAVLRGRQGEVMLKNISDVTLSIQLSSGAPNLGSLSSTEALGSGEVQLSHLLSSPASQSRERECNHAITRRNHNSFFSVASHYISW